MFVRTLQDLGYGEGSNLVLERRSAEGRYERFPEIVRKVVSLKVDYPDDYESDGTRTSTCSPHCDGCQCPPAMRPASRLGARLSDASPRMQSAGTPEGNLLRNKLFRYGVCSGGVIGMSAGRGGLASSTSSSGSRMGTGGTGGSPGAGGTCGTGGCGVGMPGGEGCGGSIAITNKAHERSIVPRKVHARTKPNRDSRERR